MRVTRARSQRRLEQLIPKYNKNHWRKFKEAYNKNKAA